MLKILKLILYDQPPLENLNAYSTIRNNQTIRRIANAPTTKQQNKWENAGNIRGQILGVTLLPFLDLDAIVVLEIGANYGGYVPHMHMFGLCEYVCVCHRRLTPVLQTLVLFVNVLLQDGYS